MAQQFEPGSWVLIHATDESTSWPWELHQVRDEDARGFALARPLLNVAPGRTEVSVRRVEPLSKAAALPRLNKPLQGEEVAGDELRVEGEAPQGARVLVFVDGVESAEWEVSGSGRFESVIKIHLSPGSHQLQLVSGLAGVWKLGSESVSILSLAPPDVPVVLEPTAGAYTNDTTPLFRGTAQAGATVIVAIAGTDVGSTPVDSMGNWSLSLGTPLAEGSYNASIRAQAPNGETSGAAFVSFRVDVTPPRVSITETPRAYTSATSVSVRFNASEAGVVECILDGVSIGKPCYSPVRTPDLAEGAYVLVFVATDRAGNVDPSPTRVQWVVDRTQPTIEFLEGPSASSKAENVSFLVKASEEVDFYECSVDEGTWAFCSEEPKVFGLIEGTHSLAVRATDKAGNISPTIHYPWEADFTAPATPVLLQPVASALLNDPTPGITGTAEPGATVKAYFKGIEACAAPVDLSGSWSCRTAQPLTTGAYDLTLTVEDPAGNINAQFVPISLDIDVDVPDTAITEGPEAFTRSASQKFAFSSTERDVTFECSMDDASFAPCDNALPEGMVTAELGRHILRVRARDRAGNVDDTPAAQEWVYSIYEGSGSGLLNCSASGTSSLLPLVSLVVALAFRRPWSWQRKAVGGKGLLVALGVGLVGSAHAQGFDLQQYKSAPGQKDVLGVYNPEITAEKTVVHAGLSLNYANKPLVLRTVSDEEVVQNIAAGQLTADVLASISFLDHFEVGLALPVTSQWGPEPGRLGAVVPENAPGTGLGDLRLVPKVAWPLGSKFRVGAIAAVSLPTGQDEKFLGAGGVGIQPMVLAQWAARENLKVIANAGGRFQPEKQVELLDLKAGNAFTYALGTQWSFANKTFAQVSLDGAVALSGEQSRANSLGLLGAVGYLLTDTMAVRLGGGTGFTRGYGSPKGRFFVSIDWSQPVPGHFKECRPEGDDDGDRVLNSGDQCPYAPGSLGNGCPPDASTERVSALVQRFKNDRDRDGLVDDADVCPNEPGVEERRGCAVPSPSAGKASEFLVVKFSSPVDGRELAVPPGMETVVTQAQQRLKDGQLGEVRVKLPPSPADKKERELMERWTERVRGHLEEKLSLPKGSEMLKVEFAGKPARRSGGKLLFDADFTLVPAPPVQAVLKCGGQVAARLMWSYGGVTTGTEGKQDKLSNEDTVCVGGFVKTGAESGAVLVLADGDVLRLAPESQVTLGKEDVQVEGTAERQGRSAALAAPEIPCKSDSISWGRVQGVGRYLVQVSPGADFNEGVRFAVTDRREVSLESLNLPTGGTWFWRVFAVDTQGDKKGFTGKPSKVHAL
ncbi:Ig-like domain-containing protein [Stigmatella aurantiaca]|nr:Ig-like domain-containing protein [Stigmatella aurantiaca]